MPNERLAQSSIVNHTVIDARVQVEVSVWVAPGADLERALALISSEEDGRTGDCGGDPTRRACG